MRLPLREFCCHFVASARLLFLFASFWVAAPAWPRFPVSPAIDHFSPAERPARTRRNFPTANLPNEVTQAAAASDNREQDNRLASANYHIRPRAASGGQLRKFPGSLKLNSLCCLPLGLACKSTGGQQRRINQSHGADDDDTAEGKLRQKCHSNGNRFQRNMLLDKLISQK